MEEKSIFHMFLYHNLILSLFSSSLYSYYSIMKIPNKLELQQIESNNLSDIDFKDFMKFYKPYSFLVNDTTLSSDNPLRFRKDLL